MNKLVVIVVVLIMVFAGLIAYHIYNEPADQHFYLHMHILNSTAIGNFSIGSYHYDIKYPWFNTTMAGYNNYTIQFQNYITYNNISNKTAHLYLVKNTTFTFYSTLWYVPINITNTNDTATTKNFQAMVKINWSAYSKYLLPTLSNVRFYNSTLFTPSHELAAWMENNNTLQAHSSIVWVNMSGTVITGKSSVKIYMLFGPSTENFGKHWGEAPQLSATYGQYDNGAKVFTYYNANPADTTGWTIAGSAGLSTAAPSGSYFKAPNAYYANSANGDYMYKPVSGLAPGTVLTFWVYTTGLGDLFFMCNSSGAGQMARLDGRNTYGDWASQVATASWTSWSNPSSGLLEPANTWFKIDVVIGATSSTMYIAPADTAIGTVGTEANAYTFTNNGNYLGLVGDALGSTYITYWNGFVIRAYPPGGVMPASQFLSPALSNILNSSPVYQGQIYLE